jgi:outer membrane lipoprotein-sorting protein
LKSRMLLLLSVILIFAAAGTRADGESKKIDPKEILASIKTVYSSCLSYQDTGRVKDYSRENKLSRVILFKTYFKRPELFRFEWMECYEGSDNLPRLIWSNGKEFFTYWAPDRRDKNETLFNAIAGASGVSCKAAFTVPNFIFESKIGLAFEVMTDLKLSETVAEGKSYYLLSGTGSIDNRYEFWIGKNDGRIYKLKDTSRDGSYTEEIHKEITFNEDINAQLFNAGESQINLKPSDCEEK